MTDMWWHCSVCSQSDSAAVLPGENLSAEWHGVTWPCRGGKGQQDRTEDVSCSLQGNSRSMKFGVGSQEETGEEFHFEEQSVVQ